MGIEFDLINNLINIAWGINLNTKLLEVINYGNTSYSDVIFNMVVELDVGR